MNRLSADQLPQETQGFIDEYVCELKSRQKSLANEKIIELIQRYVRWFKPKPTEGQLSNYFISRGLFV